MACGLHYDSFLKNHDPGAAHPERSNRASFVYRELEKSGLLDKTLPLKLFPVKLPISKEFTALIISDKFKRKSKRARVR